MIDIKNKIKKIGNKLSIPALVAAAALNSGCGTSFTLGGGATLPVSKTQDSFTLTDGAFHYDGMDRTYNWETPEGELCAVKIPVINLDSRNRIIAGDEAIEGSDLPRYISRTTITGQLGAIPLGLDVERLPNGTYNADLSYLDFGLFGQGYYDNDTPHGNPQGEDMVAIVGAYLGVQASDNLYARLLAGVTAQDNVNFNGELEICYLPFVEQNFRAGLIGYGRMEVREEEEGAGLEPICMNNGWVGGGKMFVALDPSENLTVEIGPTFDIYGERSMIGFGAQATLHLGKEPKNLESIVDKTDYNQKN